MKTKDELREAAEIAGTRAFPAHPHFRGTGADLYIAGYEAGKQERDELKVRLTEAEYVISGMHHLGTSTAAVNASTALNAYLEKYGMKKPLPESYTEGE